MDDSIRLQLVREAAATLRSYRELSETALARVSDAAFFAQGSGEENNLAVLVKHLAGNLRSRWTDFLSTDGEKPDRDRDGEFEIRRGDSRATLMRAWDRGWETALGSLEALTPADLGRTVRIRGEEHTVLRAILRQTTHVAYHAGQIVLLARASRNGDWESLSMPRRRAEGDGGPTS